MHSRIIGLDLEENINDEDFIDNGFIDGNHDYVFSLSKKCKPDSSSSISQKSFRWLASTASIIISLFCL